MVSMFKREIKLGNAVLEYSGSDHVVERLNCTDKIEEEIIVQVISLKRVPVKEVLSVHLNCTCSVGSLSHVLRWVLQVLSVGNLFNPDVRYSFNIPIEDKPQQFFWDAYGPWQECSRLCQGQCVFVFLKVDSCTFCK